MKQVQSALSLLAAAASFGVWPALAQDAADRAQPAESILISEVARLNNQSLLWGPYKPNLYFGVRPRIPKSLWTGLMWVKVDDYQDLNTGMPWPNFSNARRLRGTCG